MHNATSVCTPRAWTATGIVGNTFAGNPESGLSFDGSDNVLTGNYLDRNGDGIAFGGDDNVVSGNRITRTLGCSDGCGYGISFEGGRQATATRDSAPTSLADLDDERRPAPCGAVRAVVRG